MVYGGFNTPIQSIVSGITEFHVMCILCQKLPCSKYGAFRKRSMYFFLVFGEGGILLSGHTAEADSVLCFGEGLSYLPMLSVLPVVLSLEQL